ncbi:hypothetical protein SAMN05660690_4122 [Geodermatophilus telluris]|uniref:Uncharacterized protein n=1 Tax=Geodermatophilus telluris TaxID=1190417 RepID=A0A1G6UB35_9ACTN|nr:hypothetical protein [Geodermatophilus telluris]SDD37906.1 hypothetical protein SAMN05660690_4122 [Geodermatophilus telluris]
MLSEQDLDALLAGAATPSDADLPPLPEEFLDLVTADVGLSLVADEPASVVAARQLVADARADVRRGRRRPGRRAVVRVTTALVAVAAAATTAVLVGSPDTPAGSTATPTATAPVTPGGLSGRIALVAAEEVTFPVTLAEVPEGLTPSYSRRGGIPRYGSTPPFYVADYAPADPGAVDPGRVLLGLFPEDPRSSGEYGFSPEGEPTGTATVDGAEAAVWRERDAVSLLWQRPDGRWVWLLGEGPQADTASLVRVAGSIVDRPQPVGLQFGLAPAGWSVGGYEESRSLDLVSDADPALLLRVSVVGAEYPGTPEELLEGIPVAGPPESVTVQGRPGLLAAVEDDAGGPGSWTLVGRLPDGRLFLLLAPRQLTRDQVLQIGDQVTASS